MERLTRRMCGGFGMVQGAELSTVTGMRNAVNRLAAYEDTGLAPEEINELLHDSTGPFHKKLGEWIDAEREGRLMILPAKLSEPVFVLTKVVSYGYPDPVTRVEIREEPFSYGHLYHLRYVFRTREEAETALKGEANGNM